MSFHEELVILGVGLVMAVGIPIIRCACISVIRGAGSVTLFMKVSHMMGW